MKLSFRQSGGIAGLSLGCDLDTEDLPKKNAAQIQQLVKKLPKTGIRQTGPQGARDLQSYEIVVDAEDGRRTISFDDMSVPQEVEPLLEFLRGRAKSVPPR